MRSDKPCAGTHWKDSVIQVLNRDMSLRGLLSSAAFLGLHSLARHDSLLLHGPFFPTAPVCFPKLRKSSLWCWHLVSGAEGRVSPRSKGSLSTLLLLLGCSPWAAQCRGWLHHRGALLCELLLLPEVLPFLSPPPPSALVKVQAQALVPTTHLCLLRAMWMSSILPFDPSRVKRV